jgi:hypothetical protein
LGTFFVRERLENKEKSGKCRKNLEIPKNQKI